jgi:alpha-1,6-mannosyltransferase
VKNDRGARRRAWAAIVVLVVVFAAVPPLFSHDIYSYVDYARLGVLHGLNPYLFRPDSAPSDPAFAHVAWTHVVSAYGPLFTLATYPLAWLPVPTAVAALKLAAGASVLAIAALVARLAPARGVSPLGAAAFVALNPVVLLQVLGGGHNDAVAMLAATIGIAAVLTAREATGGAAFAAAFFLKPPAGLAAPFALLSQARVGLSPQPIGVEVQRGAPGRLIAGAALAAAAIGVAAYLAFGWHWLHTLELIGNHQGKTTHLSVPTTAARLTGLGETPIRTAALGLYAALFVFLLFRTWRGADWLRMSAWAAFGLLLATAWLLPWYLIWALPQAALSRDRPLQLLLVAMTAFQLFARVPF